MARRICVYTSFIPVTGRSRGVNLLRPHEQNLLARTFACGAYNFLIASTTIAGFPAYFSRAITDRAFNGFRAVTRIT